MRNNRLWENINKISIVFVFTVMCVITGVTNVRADDARCTYYREITEDENLKSVFELGIKYILFLMLSISSICSSFVTSLKSYENPRNRSS